MFDIVNKQSVRILFDLQACQTDASAKRGVGRFSHSLFTAITEMQSDCDIYALISDALRHSVTLQNMAENKIIRIPKLPEWNIAREHVGGNSDHLDSLFLSSLIAPVLPDVIYVSHIFEGLGDRTILPAIPRKNGGQIVAATLYDLIPLIFRDPYLLDERMHQWYYSRISWLRQADLLLAISESSKQDAINLLGIEPWRIVTILGGVEKHFVPSTNIAALRKKLAERYAIKSKFVLYTGGDDHRKNIRGAILGYAKLPVSTKKEYQLVIVCAMEQHRREMYSTIAKEAGLADNEIIITGYVPEPDLLSFYQSCDAFVFPSLYEGLGLPVLEAMACGAPVIGGNNSSVAEIIKRKDALFDSSSAEDIAAKINNVLTNQKFSDDLRKYGQERARDYSWKNSASKALDAINHALDRKRQQGVLSAVNGWIPKKRLAVLSPLPPCRSGIADYNAKFLPYLARHFDIDLYTDGYQLSDKILQAFFRVFDIKKFESVAENYDAILYEFGNSEFHAHMLSLLERFPGVVGLHDGYLSGLFGYMSGFWGEHNFSRGNFGNYAQEMLYAHGPRARKFFAPINQHPDPNGGSMVELPCTKKILDLAMGVISHSAFNLELARKNYPEGWQAPYKIIPQMVFSPQETDKKEREKIRKRKGYADGDVIIASFGHIAWTKWGDRLLDAFLRSTLVRDRNIHLVFVGELSKDDFGMKLKESIDRCDIRNRITITGFLSEADYESYLKIIDVAVQLRTKSRGGTPKGVLDCLAYGAPVIVNNDASYRDYPDDIVIKLSADPTISEVSACLEKFCNNARLRQQYSKAGRQYVREFHAPEKCAAMYAAAIDEFVEKKQQLGIKTQALNLAPYLAQSKNIEKDLNGAVSWLENVQSPHFKRRNIFIDVSYIAVKDENTGIPRVVRQIIQALYNTDRAGIEPVAVELKDGKLYHANDWLIKRGLLIKDELSTINSFPVVFSPGDILLMLDSSWARIDEFTGVFEQARLKRTLIYTVVYDLLPLILPPGNIVEGGKEWFEGWFNKAVKASDGLIAISQSVANDIHDYIALNYKDKSVPSIGYWHLGSDFSSSLSTSGINDSVNLIKAQAYILMVGTIEPRKSHALALAAMEKLWKEGHELCLCIAGKEGWMVSELMEKLRKHPLRGKKLFLFEGISDSEISYLYKNAKGLLFLSKGEGFGLPIIEAAHYGIPVICSDIPVFHEIAGTYATYIKLEGPEVVATSISDWWKKYQSGTLPDTKNMPYLTWEQSADKLLEVILNNHWIY